MEINLKKLGEQAIESTATAQKMRLSEDAGSMVFQLFTKNVYSNPIGTVVREITSNCFDSHTEAGVQLPVLIKKHQDNQTGTHYISFIDYGVGMSPDRVMNIYGVYFESTKRVDNTQIGGFGIGGKTPLAYKRSTGQGEGEYDNSFFVITIFNKVKYLYCIYEGSESPIISEIHREETTEGNGTEIQIPVLERDLSNFTKEMVRQLYYFENIVFEGFEDDYRNEILTNDYQIIRGKNFLFRGGDYDSNVHVCLGRVAYPIDYSILGLSSGDYQLPIGLKLEVGDIGVTVSRESLDYSEATIKMLKKKLEDAKAEIIALINRQYQDIQTLEQYFSVKNDFGKLLFKNGTSMYVGNLIKQKDIDFSNFKYQFMRMPNDKQLFKFFFEVRTYGKKPSRRRYGRSSDDFVGGYEAIVNRDDIYYYEDDFNRKIIKQAWLNHNHTTYYMISKNQIASKWVINDIADLFNVSMTDVVDDKGKYLPFIVELLEMQEEYMEIVRANLVDYEEVEVPEDFILSRKRGSGITLDMRKTTIPVKFVGGYSKERVKLSALFDYNMPIYYGTADDEYDLRRAVDFYGILFHNKNKVTHCNYSNELTTYNSEQKNSIAFIQIAQGNVKFMKHCKNAQPVKMFFNTMLQRKEDVVRNYFSVYNIIEQFDKIGGFYKDGFIDRVDKTTADKVKLAKNFINTIPNEAKNRDISSYRSALGNYLNLEDIKNTKEELKQIALIEEILEIQKANQHTIGYFNMPWSAENMEEELCTILSVAMKF